MRLFRRLVAAVLLAVWLPVTLHCNLEAAGLLTQQCPTTCLPGDHASDDGCSLLETGLFTKASLPSLICPPGGLVLMNLSLAGPSGVHPPSVVEMAPVPCPKVQELRCTWHFAQRAAPPCRAPSQFV